MLRNVKLFGGVIRKLTGNLRAISTHEPENHEPMIPPYEEKLGETLKLKKAR